MANDPKTDQPYYYNEESGETTWEKPHVGKDGKVETGPKMVYVTVRLTDEPDKQAKANNMLAGAMQEFTHGDAKSRETVQGKTVDEMTAEEKEHHQKLQSQQLKFRSAVKTHNLQSNIRVMKAPMLKDLRLLLLKHDDNTLRMWRRVFDPMLHLKVNFKDFCKACPKLGFHEDCVRLFVEAGAIYQDDLMRHLEFHKRRRKLHAAYTNKTQAQGALKHKTATDYFKDEYYRHQDQAQSQRPNDILGMARKMAIAKDTAHILANKVHKHK